MWSDSIFLHTCADNTCNLTTITCCRQKVEAKLPTLKVNLSDEKIQMFANFFKRLPVPHSSSMMGLEDMVDGGVPIEPLTASMVSDRVSKQGAWGEY